MNDPEQNNSRPSQEDNWQVNGVQTARLKCSSLAKGNSCPVNQYSIVASRGDLARNNCTARETPAPCIVDKRNKATVNASTRAKHRDNLPLKGDIPCERLAKDAEGPATDLRKAQRPIRKSFSVPDYLREGLWTTRKIGRGSGEESILKKSSAFLSNFTHPADKIRKSNNSDGRKQSNRCGESNSARYPSFKGYLSLLNDHLDPFQRAPTVQTLLVERRKTNGVKKSVSFSSDTSFEEKRAPYKRAAVHEVKVYHKGVLQDRSVREVDIVAKVPSSWEETSEGPAALLRAARDADDAVLNEIAVQVRKFGFGSMDVNMADSSGRTAISYMAGNGASTMLELALSFERADPNIPDNEGNTPLHFAAQAGQTECLNILLQRCPEIEVDARNASGFTPLMKAALQGRTKCAKILLFAGANPTLRDHGRGLRAEQWARFCGRYVCAEVIERFARHRLLERSTSCRWGSEPELAAKVLQGKVVPIPATPLSSSSSGLKSKIRKVFRTTSGPDRNFSLVSQLTSAALCASSPALPKSSDVPPVVKSLLRPLSVPQLRVTLVSPQDFIEQSKDKYGSNFTEKIENAVAKPSRSKKKNK
ncbi:Ankyrin repeat domain-containing protein [Apis cerana cerana]|uniref:Ankyrin repeat domain-containing protein n=1 Tax=Apis cerana cerana TaxID=94128 RepID=A0A2A3ET75_APICC|nr:Ankyrin repeat domain-containing protein [Apis cerana cerana]